MLNDINVNVMFQTLQRHTVVYILYFLFINKSSKIFSFFFVFE